MLRAAQILGVGQLPRWKDIQKRQLCTCCASEPSSGSSSTPYGSSQSKLKDAKFVPYYGQKQKSNQIQDLYLNEAAQVFVAGVESGAKPEQMLKGILGSKTMANLSDEYIEKLSVTLAKRAEKVEERRKQEDNKIDGYRLGQKLYERGFYDQAMEQFRIAEQQAKGDDEKAVEVFTAVATGHPIHKVRIRAANLCLVAKAPIIALGADEKVSIPVVESQERSDRDRRRKVANVTQRKSTEPNSIDLLFSRLSFVADWSDVSESDIMLVSVSIMATPLVLVGWQILQRRLAMG